MIGFLIVINNRSLHDAALPNIPCTNVNKYTVRTFSTHHIAAGKVFDIVFQIVSVPRLLVMTSTSRVKTIFLLCNAEIAIFDSLLRKLPRRSDL